MWRRKPLSQTDLRELKKRVYLDAASYSNVHNGAEGNKELVFYYTSYIESNTAKYNLIPQNGQNMADASSF